MKKIKATNEEVKVSAEVKKALKALGKKQECTYSVIKKEKTVMYPEYI